MNSRIVKLRAEYEKNEAKIGVLKSRNEKLGKKIQELENTERMLSSLRENMLPENLRLTVI